MKKILPLFFAVCLLPATAVAQQVTGILKFEQGQALTVSMKVKTTISQQAMGQAIDFNVEATGDHCYTVTNATEDNTTLHHTVQRIAFVFDGMGQKRNFDSNNEKDLSGPFGKPIGDLLKRKYDMIIDPFGKALLVQPEKVEMASSDSRMVIINGMMKDVFNATMPPKKGSYSMFRVLPDTAAGKGQPWTISYTDESGKYDGAYSISDINDTTIVVDFAESSVTVSKAEMMGSETTTTMNNKSTGKIILDRATGIMREKTTSTESNGTTEAAFGSLPVTSKTTTVITVKPTR